ncbi:hypothetical protein [Paenibacillus uliginis]|uniref:hypothetical protein n=1 Tax=Paenibacillus uliginis TaxID=683737 RepID=UPI001AD8003D|nr:hypothetical protein [Paenibacillus uliginis]
MLNQCARVQPYSSAKSFNDIDPVIGPLFDQFYISLTKVGVNVGTAALATFEVDENGEGMIIVAAAYLASRGDSVKLCS